MDAAELALQGGGGHLPRQAVTLDAHAPSLAPIAPNPHVCRWNAGQKVEMCDAAHRAAVRLDNVAVKLRVGARRVEPLISGIGGQENVQTCDVDRPP
jgi:hypothetical protein